MQRVKKCYGYLKFAEITQFCFSSSFIIERCQRHYFIGDRHVRPNRCVLFIVSVGRPTNIKRIHVEIHLREIVINFSQQLQADRLIVKPIAER